MSDNYHTSDSKYSDPLLEKENQGSILTGLIGGIIGAALGVLLYGAVAILTERYFSFLGILIGVFAYFGFNLFKGKKNLFAAIILMIITLAIGAIGYFGMIYWYAKDFITLDYYLQHLGDAFDTFEFIKFMAFVFIGSLFSLMSVIDDRKKPAQSTIQPEGLENNERETGHSDTK